MARRSGAFWLSRFGGSHRIVITGINAAIPLRSLQREQRRRLACTSSEGESALIEDADTARYLSELLLDVNARLIESIHKVEESCSVEESAIYKMRLGRLINSIFESLLEPIYEDHPALKPRGLD